MAEPATVWSEIPKSQAIVLQTVKLRSVSPECLLGPMDKGNPSGDKLTKFGLDILDPNAEGYLRAWLYAYLTKEHSHVIAAPQGCGLAVR